MTSCVIGIPVYKSTLNNTEKISLKRIHQCFKNETIVFIAPEGIDFNFTNILPKYNIRYYPKYFFENRRSYSQLLLSTSFYKSFEKFEYLLICQLDVFVFSNRLEEFCNLGYDYIGAPMYFPFGAKVGNGGFSLRKIASCLRMLNMRDRIYVNNPWQLSLEMMEDQFFSYCGTMTDFQFKVSEFELAKEFAIDACFEIEKFSTRNKLPFAIHKFKFVSESWKNIIVDLGYKIPQESYKELESFKQDVQQMKNCFYEYKLYQSPNIIKLKKIFNEIFSYNNITIWGYGTNGNRCQNLFSLVGIKIACIYDNKFSRTAYIDDVLYTNIYKTDINIDRPILISTVGYENEIINQLISRGLYKNKDFFLFSDLEKIILERYFNVN